MIIISENKMDWDSLFPPLSGSNISGLNVSPGPVPNTSSISSSLTDYEELPGLRVVPLSAFDVTDAKDLFYAVNDIKRVEYLAKQIAQNKTITPLIVVYNNEGAYVLEGGHRLAALKQLGITHFPAIVVLDNESLGLSHAEESQSGQVGM